MVDIVWHNVVIGVPGKKFTITDRVADSRDEFQRFCDKYGYILISWDCEEVSR